MAIENIENMDQAPASREKTRLNLCLFICIAIITTLFLFWLLRYSHYGIDITDEGYYLVSIADPFLYNWSVSQFGFVYHPLYQLLSGNIATLRQTNVLVTFFLAWFFFDALLKQITGSIFFRRWERLIVSSGFATSCFAIFDSWLVTPNYNSLNLQALLIASIGLLLASESDWKKKRSNFNLGCLLLGMGEWLAFMAKPTSAAAFGLLSFIYLVITRKISMRLVALSVIAAICLLLVSALAIDGSLTSFAHRLYTGFEFSKALGGGHDFNDIFRIDDFAIDTLLRRLIIIFVSGAVFSVFLLQSKYAVLRSLGATLCLTLPGLTLSIILGLTTRGVLESWYQGLLIWSAPFAATLLGVATISAEGKSTITTDRWALALFLALMPYVYAFGTNNNYWRTESSAGLFWISAGIIFLIPCIRKFKSRAIFIPIVLVCQATIAILVYSGVQYPYRQSHPLSTNNHLTQFGVAGSTLMLTASYSFFFQEVKRKAEAAGFKPKTPVIDLTGESPGILYFLEATNIGAPWIFGGYSGSIAAATAELRLIPCSLLTNAWVLVEPQGRERLPISILQSIFGADISTGYEEAASWDIPKEIGRNQKNRPQLLLKPIGPTSKALQSCTDTKEFAIR